jgi:hypothetical protein
LAHHCHDYPIHDVVHVLNLRHSNALADDRYAVLHRGHSDGHLCVNELHRHDVEHPTADVLDDHRNCVRDLDGRHRHVDDLDANRDRRNDHQTTDDQNSGDQKMDDRDRLDDRHRYADVTDDLGDLRNGHVLVDDHHHDADATDDLNRNCARDLVGRHRHVGDLDANRDHQNDHQTTDDPNLGDQMMDDQMMDDRDRLDDHHRCADATDDLNRNCVDDLVGRQHCADATDDHRYSVDVTDGHRRGADGMVVNRHDEGLWLQRHLGVLDGLNHYLVLGDADRFCLV